MSHQNGATSKITIKDGIVTKKVIHYLEYSTFSREIHWLKYLNNKKYPWCPKLISFNLKEKSFQLDYVGERISKMNAPLNWQGQLEAILEDLSRENLFHNDIKPSDLLVKNKKLFLIDYGWMTKGKDWSCGGRFNSREKPHHKFPDSGAIQRIETALGESSVPEEKIKKFVQFLEQTFKQKEEWDGEEILKNFWGAVFY